VKCPIGEKCLVDEITRILVKDNQADSAHCCVLVLYFKCACHYFIKRAGSYCYTCGCADAASCAIVKFLEIESTEELSNGWMLLCTINLLSMGADTLIDSMTVASLPSTLVKCLYLFFDLPDISQPDTLQPGCEFTPRESRVLLQKVFVQVRFHHTNCCHDIACSASYTVFQKKGTVYICLYKRNQ